MSNETAYLDPSNGTYSQCALPMDDHQELLYHEGSNYNSQIYVEFNGLCYNVSQCKGQINFV